MSSVLEILEIPRTFPHYFNVLHLYPLSRKVDISSIVNTVVTSDSFPRRQSIWNPFSERNRRGTPMTSIMGSFHYRKHTPTTSREQSTEEVGARGSKPQSNLK